MERDGRIIIGGKMYNITHYTGIFRTFNATFSGTDDVDWCSQPLLNSCTSNNSSTQSTNRVCVDGGLRYRCQCQRGFEDIDGRCTVPSVCPNNTFGTNCSQCQCNVTNTVSCDNVTGNCTCDQGWTGATCDTDVDECVTDALSCSDPHDTCSNMAGGFTCVCDDGYERDSDNTCRELKKIPVRMTLPASVNFSAEELDNRSSPAFQAVSDVLVPQLWLSLGPAAEQVQSITITKISLGSIIVEFEILMKNLTYSEDASVVYNAVSRFSEATYNISGQVCQATNFSVNDTQVNNPCDVFIALKYCSSNEFCQVSNRIPTCVQCPCNATNTALCDPVTGNCTCKDGWTGATCDEDIDECLTSPCSGPYAICMNTLGTYTCLCVDGYYLNASNLCQECTNNTYGSNCSSKCLCDLANTVSCDHVTGNCTCETGWTGATCDLDVDECLANVSICNGPHEVCNNTLGGHDCLCVDGYQKNGNNTCTACTAGTFGKDCSSLCTCITHNTVNCSNVDGACTCQSGWNGTRCEQDIDECALSQPPSCVANSTCSNTNGSYLCVCDTGYLSLPDGNCTACTGNTFGANCSEHCECNITNTVSCDHVTGSCNCKKGWDGVTCDVRDLCSNVTSNCTGDKERCNNTENGPECVCEDGYHYNASGVCVVCANNTYGANCSSQCLCDVTNTVSCDHVTGNCTCEEGWAGATCDQDVDECLANVSICNGPHEVCNNTLGGHDCLCVDGYQKNDTDTCTACTEGTYGKDCSSRCTCVTHNTVNCSNVDGACTCQSGWNGSRCEQDIDECAHSQPPSCVANSTCSNTNGSYLCVCDTGYLSLPDGNCTACTGNTFGANCSKQCRCNLTNTVSCDHVTGDCDCKKGWDGVACDVRDLCSNVTSNCTGDKERCNNTESGPECVCEDGYHYNASGVCVECSTGTYGGNCSSTCTCITNNTVNCSKVDGACTCRSGWTGGNCSDDINECTAHSSSPCVANSTCHNTNGSYLCVCDTGYHTHADGNCTECVNNTYGTNCTSPCQCNVTNTVSCHHVTGNCTCKQGWEGHTCDTDIDECVTHNCSGQYEMCHNIAGGYDCVCVTGYQRSASSICIPCAAGTFGNNCTLNCTCVTNNTVNCSNVDGNCTCNIGWTGRICEQDIDECTQSPPPSCVANSTCSNTNGSYLCVCDTGYQTLTDGNCTACTGNTFGANCSKQCLCNLTNTVSCDHVTGKCNCKRGWDGATCNIKDQCPNVSSNCTGDKERCNNTENGPECVCEDGYHYNASGVCVECSTGTYGGNCSSLCTCITNNTVNCSKVDGACTCRSGWTGGNCSDDINECTAHSSSPCVANSTCYNTNGSYLCVCDTGYQTHADGNCTECVNNYYGTNCSSQCQCDVTNTMSCDHVTGNCTCEEGWTGASCELDVDECLANVSICNGPHEVCNNTLGGHDCLCVDGYQKNGTNTCTACTGNTFGANCSEHCECNVTNTVSCDHVTGSCNCSKGWVSATCNIKDLCSNLTLNCTGDKERCNNTENGPECVCEDGYHYNASGVCVECSSGTYGGNCSSTCTCVTNNTVNCSKVDGACTCRSGWTGGNCSDDINECTAHSSSPCVANSTCYNTNGSYLCVCDTGYQTHADGNCTECVNNTYGTNCSSQCQCNVTNTVSCHHVTANCTCKQGWSGSKCNDDLDECSSNTHNCTSSHQMCINSAGGFTCVCADGYHYNASMVCDACGPTAFGRNCSLTCPCVTNNTVSCNNVNGSCTCNSGWNGTKCEQDINECAQSPPPSCVANSTCVNTNGSYLCVCNTGYQTLLDGNCTECTNDTYGSNCSTQCQCNVTNTVSCHHVTGNCTCKQGWTGPTCDTDIDECVTHNCSGQNEMCHNTAGGYDCVCVTGYQRSASSICIPCAAGTYGNNCTLPCTCITNNTANCSNVDGACTCNIGWRGKSCEQDIDECKQSPPPSCVANSTCSNTNGGYLCVCDTGFHSLLDGNCTACTGNTFGANCSRQCQCNVTNTVSCDHVTGSCNCSKGWDGAMCNIKDLCSNHTLNCTGDKERCNNTENGPECVCEDGYHYNASGVCVECSSGTYGGNCSSLCTCITENTVNCSKVDGACTCRSGWTGGNCSDDINECTAHSSSPCVANSTCYNTNGSYLCVCDTGYLTHADGNCTECVNNTYGTNCRTQCQCNVTNTVSCHHVTGNCTCKQGWTGPNCDNDIDECSSNSHSCRGLNQTCSNTAGGFTCVCTDGYHYNASMVCEDIDECVTHNCSGQNEMCHNTAGSYECVCVAGYQKGTSSICIQMTKVTIEMTLSVEVGDKFSQTDWMTCRHRLLKICLKRSLESSGGY
ncbi:multiple epidermal growth factor-like domains protein 6 isoform X4 [Pomacea canaliculata]|uniref:multiple epidermal growth factor-like domains protein 6 isoform X4 n=1 Tax=Pomacea canaliculata TaxID=400727 RepID=UPI000D73CA97|nr:multiple epidermal growth factor-like domains protein 6 isoform X4 [Pomacea canaliculata]